MQIDETTKQHCMDLKNLIISARAMAGQLADELPKSVAVPARRWYLRENALRLMLALHQSVEPVNRLLQRIDWLLQTSETTADDQNPKVSTED